MIAKVLGFSNWTVYQGLNADWDFDTYRTRQRAHFDKQAKQVKSNGVTLDNSGTVTFSNGDGDTSTAGTLTVGASSDMLNRQLGVLADKLTSIAGGIVEMNRNLGQLVSLFEHIDDE